LKKSKELYKWVETNAYRGSIPSVTPKNLTKKNKKLRKLAPITITKVADKVASASTVKFLTGQIKNVL